MKKILPLLLLLVSLTAAAQAPATLGAWADRLKLFGEKWIYLLNDFFFCHCNNYKCLIIFRFFLGTAIICFLTAIAFCGSVLVFVVLDDQRRVGAAEAK